VKPRVAGNTRSRTLWEEVLVGKAWYWLLLVPLVGTLIPPIYNSDDPRLIGIPFFYWYQMVWIPISVTCTILVYRRTRGDR
jgi:hypothetical protein